MTEPKVSIIVTAYLPENKKYLDLCIKSIKNLNYANFEAIIVGRPDYLPEYESIKTVSPSQDKFWPPVGLNFGIAQADVDSKYYFVLNDDTILTRNSLRDLVLTYEQTPGLGVLMPISNDQQMRYAAWLPFVGPTKMEDIKKQENQDFLMNYDSPYHPALSIHDTLCIYAFLISREAFEKIGKFDENLIGQDDIDFTMRARHQGLINAIAFNSVVWHFGGVSSEKTFTDEDRSKSFEIFNKKWR